MGLIDRIKRSYLFTYLEVGKHTRRRQGSYDFPSHDTSYYDGHYHPTNYSNVHPSYGEYYDSSVVDNSNTGASTSRAADTTTSAIADTSEQTDTTTQNSYWYHNNESSYYGAPTSDYYSSSSSERQKRLNRMSMPPISHSTRYDAEGVGGRRMYDHRSSSREAFDSEPEFGAYTSRRSGGHATTRSGRHAYSTPLRHEHVGYGASGVASSVPAHRGTTMPTYDDPLTFEEEVDEPYSSANDYYSGYNYSQYGNYGTSAMRNPHT